MKKRNKRIILFVIVLLCAAGTVWGWRVLRQKDDAAKSGPPTAKVSRRDMSLTVLATGAVKPQVGAEVKVGARITGKVFRLHANIGDVVKKGQVLAELEKADLQARVDLRAAELEMARAKLSAVMSLRPREIEKAEADVAQWQTTVEFNRKELAREEELLKQDFTSQQACDRAREQLNVSLSRLSAAQKALELARKGFEEDIRQTSAEIKRAEAALTDAKTQLSYATIIAPVDGVIASISTQEGETVAAGLNAPTFVTIIDLGRLQVDTFVDEVDIGKIQIGQKVIFTVDAFPAREFEGKVTAVYPKAVIQENVVNYDVVVNITSPYDGLLRPEMTASVTISLKPRQNALSVPSQAIQRQRGKSIVFVQTPAGSEEREVKVGWRDGQWVEVVQGLREGETVLLEAPNSKSEVTK